MSDTKQPITAEEFANLCGRCIVENSILEKENQVLPTYIIKLHLEQFANLQSKFHVEKIIAKLKFLKEDYQRRNQSAKNMASQDIPDLQKDRVKTKEISYREFVYEIDSILNAYDINKIG